jgi:hypothetical protein
MQLTPLRIVVLAGLALSAGCGLGPGGRSVATVEVSAAALR